jgi:hypothetical protein
MMNLRSLLTGSKNQKVNHNDGHDNKDAFTQIGREQFKKLLKLGLQIPIAVL